MSVCTNICRLSAILLLDMSLNTRKIRTCSGDDDWDGPCGAIGDGGDIVPGQKRGQAAGWAGGPGRSAPHAAL